MLGIDVLSRLPPPRPYSHQASHGRLRQLNRRCCPLSEATTAQIQALPLEQLEAVAVGAAFSARVALLDFQGPADLAAWLAAHTTKSA
jgi:hypothetical protein